MRRLNFFAAAGLLLAAVLPAGCSRPAPAGAAPGGKPLFPLRFQTDWYPQVEHGGFYQALARGYYREAGLDVTILPGGPGPRVQQLVLSGRADIAMDQSCDLIENVSRGLPLLIIGATMQHSPQALLLHAENPVSSFRELDGKTVMAVPGSDWIAFLRARYGIGFNLIPSDFGLARFMADKNFIQQCFVTDEPYFVRRHGARPKTLLLSASGYDPYLVFFTTKKFAREHPDAVRAFVAASVRGWQDFVSGDPSPAMRLIAARNPKMTDDFMRFGLAQMKALRLVGGDPARGERTGLLTRRRIQDQIDLLVRLKIIPAPMRPEEVADFDFLPADLQQPAQ